MKSNNIDKGIDIKTKEPVSGIGVSLYSDDLIYQILYLKNGLPDKFVRNYYKSGKIKDETLYKDGKPYGIYMTWYENGNLEFMGSYLNGLLDGRFIYHYKSGNIYIVTNMKQGNRNGLQETYSEAGELLSTKEFHNDVRDGRFIEYYDNKNILSRGRYCLDLKCGTEQLFYESGELNTEIQYINGRKNGKSVFYLKNGKVCATFIYKEDKIISGFAKNGRKFNHAELVNWDTIHKTPCD